MDLWAYRHKVVLEFSRPGRPTDNAQIESFNGNLWDECLNLQWFSTIDDAREKHWRHGDVNTMRVDFTRLSTTGRPRDSRHV